MADGTAGSVNWTEPGYDEPPRDSEGANHMTTDYAQAPAVKKARSDAFHDGRTRWT